MTRNQRKLLKLLRIETTNEILRADDDRRGGFATSAELHKRAAARLMAARRTLIDVFGGGQ